MNTADEILRRNRFLRAAVTATVNPLYTEDPERMRYYAYALRVWADKAEKAGPTGPAFAAGLRERSYTLRRVAGVAETVASGLWFTVGATGRGSTGRDPRRGIAFTDERGGAHMP